MFFRKTRTKKSKSSLLQLVENFRTDKGPRQRLIVSLGTNFKIPKNDNRAVATIVQNRLRGQNTLFDSDPKHIAYADKIIKKIQLEGKFESGREQVTKFKKAAHKTAEVFIDDVEHGYTRELGPVLIGHTFWNLSGFPEILKECGFYDKQIKTAEISVLNRLISQDSEHSILSWLNTVALEELIEIDTIGFGDDRFYRISDLLLKNKEIIEDNLYQREKDIFSLEDSVFLYDLTNTYFEGLCRLNPKAEFCKNQKEKRSDCRQVVVALMLDGDGFIRCHKVFTGKMSDSKSLKIILKELSDDFKDKLMPTIIFDRGVVSKDNMELICSYENLKYIVMCRPCEEAFFADDFENEEFEAVSGTESIVKVAIKERDDETFLLCKSEGRRGKETAMRNRKEQRLESEFNKLAKQIYKNKKGGVSVEQKIGRLKERYSSVAKYYEIKYDHWEFSYEITGSDISKRFLNSLSKLSQKVNHSDITFYSLNKKLDELKAKYELREISINLKAPDLTWHTIDEKEAYERQMDGNYLLKTNRNDLERGNIWKFYVMLTRVEDAFKDFKSHLGLRPNFHQKEKRVDGHIFISILAYHLLHSIQYTLRMKGEHSRWSTIRRLVSTHSYSTINLPTTNGTVIGIRKPGIPEGIHVDIYNKLDMDFERMPVSRNLA